MGIAGQILKLNVRNADSEKDARRPLMPIADGPRDSTQKSISPTPSIRMRPTSFDIVTQKWGKCECQWCNEILLHPIWLVSAEPIKFITSLYGIHHRRMDPHIAREHTTIRFRTSVSVHSLNVTVGFISQTEEKGRRVPFPFPFPFAGCRKSTACGKVTPIISDAHHHNNLFIYFIARPNYANECVEWSALCVEQQPTTWALSVLVAWESLWTSVR